MCCFVFPDFIFTFVAKIKNITMKESARAPSKQPLHYWEQSLLQSWWFAVVPHTAVVKKNVSCPFCAQALPSSSKALCIFCRLHAIRNSIPLSTLTLPFNSSSIPQLLLVLIDEPCIPAELFGLEEYLKSKTNEWKK